MAAKPKVVKKPVAKPKVAALDQRVGKDPALLARALKDPGLRSKLSDQYLTPAQREGRRLNMPVLPGSALTNRQAETQAQTAVDLQYGPGAVAKEEQRGRDTSDWYAKYQDDLRAHAANVGAINQQAAGAVQGLSQGIRPLGDQALAQEKTRETANAKITGATPADNTKTASDASAVRQALIASMGVQQAGVGASRQSLADTQANVVAPGQKLQAGAIGQQSVRDLLAKQGVSKANALGQIVAGESKNLTDAENQKLAFAIATGHDATNLAQSQITATSAAATRAQAAADRRAQRGVTIRGQDISSADRAAARTAAAKRAAAKKTPAGKSPWVNPGAQGKAADNIGQALHFAKQAKGQNLARHDASGLLVEGQKADAKTGARAVPAIDQLYASVALDIAYDGHISAANIKRLHARGIKVNSLGYPTKAPKPQRSLIDNVLHPGGA